MKLLPFTTWTKPDYRVNWRHRALGIGRDKLLYVDAVLDHIVLDQLVRKTIVFCEQKRPEMAGIEAEQFQELLVHEFRRQCAKLPLKWPVYAMGSGGVAKIPRIRRLSQYVINRELRFKADSPGCRLLVDQLMDFPWASTTTGPTPWRCVRDCRWT